MIHDDMAECTECGGDGEVIDWSRVSGRSIDPPMMRCPECGGRGVVDATRAEYARTHCVDYAEEELEARAEYYRERDEER